MNADHIIPQPPPSVEQQKREVEQQRQISEQFGKMRSGSQGKLETAKNVGGILLRRWILKRPGTE